MKKNLIVLLSLTLISITAQSGSSETLVISGTVLDRGYAFMGAGSQIAPQEGTELKVFISEIKKNSRSPQSVGDEVSAVQSWKRIDKLENLTASSYIRVEAP